MKTPKKAAWLNRGTSRGHTAKPMKPETADKIARREAAKRANTGPIADPDTGTLRYPRPRNT